jgi:hypothetical protein
VRAPGFEPWWVASHWTVLPLDYKPNRLLCIIRKKGSQNMIKPTEWYLRCSLFVGSPMMASFFERKAGALLYHLRRRAIVHHAPKRTTPHTNNTREQGTQQDTTPSQPGRRVKRSHRKPRRCHQRRATPEAATRCELQQPPELLHLELSPTSRSHMIVDPSAPTMLWQNTPIEVPKKTTELGHTLCVGASPHPPPHTPLPKTRIPETALRTTPPPS